MMARDLPYYHRWHPTPRQQHLNQYGKPKRAYATDAEAQTARVEMTYKTGFAFRVYRCQSCKQLHIGKELAD